MQYRKLGRSSVKVSEIALGGWLTQGRSISDETTTSLVHRAYDLGVNFFDTADVYNNGEAEKSLGIAIQGLRREDLFIGTKCFFPFSEKPNDRGLSRKHIVESVHASLKRLKLDYIDLMQFHRFDPETQLEESIRAVDDLIRQGKILYWGVSQWRAHAIMDAHRTAATLNAHSLVSNQPLYNMMAREIESSVIPTCTQLGIGQVVWSPLAQGVLTGKYKPGQAPPAGSRGADDKSNMFMGEVLTDEVLSRVEKLGVYAQELGLTLPQLALGWCLRQPILSSVIVGATSLEQLEANVSASGVTQPDEVWEKAIAILEGREG